MVGQTRISCSEWYSTKNLAFRSEAVNVSWHGRLAHALAALSGQRTGEAPVPHQINSQALRMTFCQKRAVAWAPRSCTCRLSGQRTGEAPVPRQISSHALRMAFCHKRALRPGRKNELFLLLQRASFAILSPRNRPFDPPHFARIH